MRGDNSPLSLRVKLRPLRLAFLVDPDDRNGLRATLEACTCLWGGRYHAIIPVKRRLPSSWQARSRRYSSIRHIVRGYIEAFEPDEIVAVSDGFESVLALNQECRKLQEIISGETEEVGYGLCSADVFAEQYESQYRFVQRHPRRVILPRASQKALDLFVGAYAGVFPSHAPLAYIQRYFVTGFGATAVELDGRSYASELREHALTPIAATSMKLEVQSRGWRHEPSLFFMDATRPLDIVDFWNLRSLGWRVIGVPKQWGKELLDFCREFVRGNHVPHRHNPNYMLGTTLIRSRSVHADEAEAYAAAIRGDGTAGLAYQRWYPRVWDEWARDKDSAMRADLSAEEKSVEVVERDGRISLEDIGPSFATGAGRDTPRWVNVIEISKRYGGDEQALVIPPDFGPVVDLLGAFGDSETRSTSEGIVVKCRWAGHPQFWTLPTGVELFRSWFKLHGFEAELSGAGKITLQVIRGLGGMIGVNAIRHPLILRTLDQMSHGLVEYEVGDGLAEKKKVRGRMLSRQDFIGRLGLAYPGSDRRPQNTLNHLVEHRALRVGVRCKCSVCGQRNWYCLSDLEEHLRCERCLETFRFPAASPPQAPWYYRTQGPFSIENYAQGAYTVALALRFFTLGVRSLAAWTPSLDLRKDDQPAGEVDFALWWRRDQFGYTTPTLVLGEAKGYGGGRPEAFAQKDIARARRLGRRFLGAALVFATLKESLSSKERQLLAGAARAGRRPWKPDQWSNPVIVLTATELFADQPPPYSWKNLPGRRGEIAARERELVDTHPLLKLADATQQAYLGLESYWDWVSARHQRAKTGAAQKSRPINA